MGAVAGVELAVDVLHVGLDGALVDVQFLRYLPIGESGLPRRATTRCPLMPLLGTCV